MWTSNLKDSGMQSFYRSLMNFCKYLHIYFAFYLNFFRFRQLDLKVNNKLSVRPIRNVCGTIKGSLEPG